MSVDACSMILRSMNDAASINAVIALALCCGALATSNSLNRLRYATENDVSASLEGAYVTLPLTTPARGAEGGETFGR